MFRLCCMFARAFEDFKLQILIQLCAILSCSTQLVSNLFFFNIVVFFRCCFCNQTVPASPLLRMALKMIFIVALMISSGMASGAFA